MKDINFISKLNLSNLIRYQLKRRKFFFLNLFHRQKFNEIIRIAGNNQWRLGEKVNFDKIVYQLYLMSMNAKSRG